MMHVRFNEAWHGKVQQTTLQIKWSSIRNELHIDETPRHVIQFDLVYVLNNIKCWLTWQEVKHNKTTYLGNLNAAETTNNNFEKSPYAYFEFGTVLP